MWLGSFFLVMYGMAESQKQLSTLFFSLHKKVLNLGVETGLVKMFIRCADVVIFEASPQRSLYTGMALYNLRILGLAPAALIMSMSTLGVWWVALLGILFLGFSGYFILGFCVLGLFVFGSSARTKTLLQFAFNIGIFLIGGESMIKNSTVLQSLLGQSDLAFFLADGRFPAVFTLLIASVLLTLVVKVEFWSFVLGLSLLLTSTVSFNGVLGMIVGERIGRMILFWWHTRSLNQDCQRIGKQLSLVSIFGVLIGFWLAGEARNLFYFDFSGDLASFQDRSLQLMGLFLLVLVCQFLAQMLWGHFGSRVKVGELQEARYFSPMWSEREYLSAAAMSWAKEKVQKRLSEIRYHLQGLGSLKEGQVPEHLQSRLKDEEQQLARLIL
ncbi:MAG: hypothetical protein OM95_01120 [Bdellovibrio sp. ArHS]|nr:MAG: hypothetical protein OM95_01120 [Bdellovibrio sp. ArHS]